MNDRVIRLAIVLSHPIQYYVPWFRQLANCESLDLKVFYLWDRAASGSYDHDFKQKVSWDTEMLSGYNYELIKNWSPTPSSRTFYGLINPSLPTKIAEYQADAVLLFGYRYVTHLYLLLSSKIKNIPILFRGDSHLIGAKPSWIKSFILRRLFSQFSAFLAVGSANRRYFSTYGVSKEKIYDCPHAIDLSLFQQSPDVKQQRIDLREQYSIERDTFVFLYAGKFTKKKQVLPLIEAFSSISDQKVALVCVGSGELEATIRDKAQQYSHIRILPFMNQSQMPALYSLADVFVLPSFSLYETWGLSVQEALAMGVPALVSDQVGSAEDLIVPGKTGWIFKAGQGDDLIAKLSDILSKREHVRALAKETRSHILQHFTYEHSTNALLKALSVLTKKE